MTGPIPVGGVGPVVVWLRRNLRVADQPTFAQAVDLVAEGRASAVLVVSVSAPRGWSPGRRAARDSALTDLLDQLDGRLLCLEGDAATLLLEVVIATEAVAVITEDQYTPAGAAQTDRVEALLPVPLLRAGDDYAVSPGTVRTGQGRAFQVFTPFRRAWSAQGIPEPVDTAATSGALRHGNRSAPLQPVDPLPATDPTRHQALAAARYVPGPRSGGATTVDRQHVDRQQVDRQPEVGERAARRRWRGFLDDAVDTYAVDRDRPDLDGTSRLSAPLAFGSIHPRQLLADLADADTTAGHPAPAATGRATFISELAWREFYADVLYHRPEAAWSDLDRRFAGYRWHESPGELSAWTEGQTGYPLVDAGMRQLAETGWMHNRVRMIVASFLVKDLHIRWQEGARVFLDRLVDADFASNQLSWQWCAGTGTDASPFFRVFNPMTQGTRFDPDGSYARRWLPELAGVPARHIHQLPLRPEHRPAGYPAPLVDHAEERREALRRWEEIRGASSTPPTAPVGRPGRDLPQSEP